MLSLDFKNVFRVDTTHGFSMDDFLIQAKKIPKFLENIRTRDQGFYSVIDDDVLVASIVKFAKLKKGKYDDIVVCGIGGSALGATCLKQSLTHLFGFQKQKQPRLYVLPNIDPTLIREVVDVIDLPRTLFLIISKSGTTPEIISQYFYFRSLIDKKKLRLADHFVFVTNPNKGLLCKEADRIGIQIFSIPDTVGGRFSVLTSVGLLPSALIGIDISKLLKGARAMRDRFFSVSFKKNLPFQIATSQFLLYQKGNRSTVLMPYAQKLIGFTNWYRQLLAESTGKAMNEKGEIVNVGLTPINALGVTDQHSQTQLYNEGPNDKFILFLTVDDLGKDIPIPVRYAKNNSVAFLRHTSFKELLDIEQHATAHAYTKNNRPNMTISISKIDEEHLGQLFFLFEGATAFLGEYFGIDVFNQPGVELSKKLTKQMLLKKR